jgi:ribosome-associated translation inhibitor RaiA
MLRKNRIVHSKLRISPQAGRGYCEGMKLTIQHFNLRSTDALDSRVEERILALESQLRIDEAIVELAHHRERSPAFRAHVHLVAPGPDLRAEGEGHTIEAALRQVMAGLRRRLSWRARKRSARLRAGPNRAGRGSRA